VVEVLEDLELALVFLLLQDLIQLLLVVEVVMQLLWVVVEIHQFFQQLLLLEVVGGRFLVLLDHLEDLVVELLVRPLLEQGILHQYHHHKEILEVLAA
jgi:hypothetical protein